MRLRVLGPLELVGPDGPFRIAAAKPRMLLLVLTIRRGSTVSTDELIDAVWGERPPASASKLLQVYVSQLRRLLPDGIGIATHPSGYALTIDQADLDVVRFETYVDEGRRALRSGNAALASAALARGLALWRGTAYADARYDAFAGEEIERLQSLRQAALEARLEADLRLGRHAEVLGELRGILSTDPTREHLASLAMIAAYRSGSPADALAIYASTRAALADELDEEPGPELVDLRARIEARDPRLDADATAGSDGLAGSRLPVAPNRLIGRHRELQELRALVDRPGVRLISLTGAGGSGKSRLALELARDLAPSFANGVVLVELASLRDADLVPATIAREAGLEPGSDAMATLADALADRELVLVLDNMEHLRAAAPQLVRLLAAAPRLVIVVTTRVVLHASGEHVYPVAPLEDADAVTLFGDRARAMDPAFALDDAGKQAVVSICRHVDGLPLAIELAAARVRALGVRTLDARLASRLAVLTGGPRDLPARQQTLRETLAWSVNHVEPAHAEVLARLAVFAGSCPMDGAQAVAGADDDAMVALVDHSLVQAMDVGGERRYRLLETVREYAYELLGDRREATESALVSWMVGVVDAVVPAGTQPFGSVAMERLDAELDNLRDALRHAARDDDPTRELAMASSIWKFWWVRGYLAEGRALYDGILARRGIVETSAGIRTVRAAASLAWSMGDQDHALDLATRAADAADRIGDVFERLSAHNVLGTISRSRGEFVVAEGHFLRAIELASEIGNDELVHMYRMNLGAAYLDVGRVAEARAHLEAVLDYRRHEGLSQGVGLTHLNLGEAYYRGDDLAAAEHHFGRAAEAFRQVGFRARLANALQGLAAVEARTGRVESAVGRLRSAAAVIGQMGWGAGDSSLEREAIAAARDALGDEVFERLFAEAVPSEIP